MNPLGAGKHHPRKRFGSGITSAARILASAETPARPLDATSAHLSDKPRRRFGQNFLVDRGIVTKVLAAIDPKAEDRVVEIGPGLGALTEPLLERLPRLDVVEIDRDLARYARGAFPPERLRIHVGDALAFDFCSLGSGLRIVGNLPYNISTPLLFHLGASSHCLRDCHFMLQREVVQRMAAAAGWKGIWAPDGDVAVSL